MGRDYARFVGIYGGFHIRCAFGVCRKSSNLILGPSFFQYDTGQISDILLMDDFLLRFAECTSPGDVSTCAFSNVRAGLIVALLSIGTLFGALMGAP
jgi:hypothetical protein